MAIASSGTVAFSQIAQIIKANASAATSLGESDTRTLLGVSSGVISITSAYSKPASNSSSYATGSYTFYVPPYQYLSCDVAGGGGGGNGGSGCSTCSCTCCCVYFGWGWGPYSCGCCGSCGGGGGGGAGGQSDFNGVVSYAGTGSTAGGNNQNGNTGGGAGGGGAGAAYGCCGGNGSVGQAGGRVQYTWTKGSNGPDYGAAINFTVGGGGGGGSSGGGNGDSGYVTVSWS